MFYQIVTTIDSVWVRHEAPPRRSVNVSTIHPNVSPGRDAQPSSGLSIFAVVVSFGISGASSLGASARGYVSELLFWMLAPAVLTLLIVIVAGGVALCQRRLDPRSAD